MIGTMGPRILFVSFIWLAAGSVAWGMADGCRTARVTTLPGSREFASDFLEAMATDPAARHQNTVWGLTADLSSNVPAEQRAMYISRSNDSGKSWTVVARVGPEYFDADIGEGERNGLAVYPGGREFVITTQRGAFQVFPQTNGDAVVKAIAGPRVPKPDPEITIPKKEGDPETAGVVKITGDGQWLIVSYGYFDLEPKIFLYRRGANKSWRNGKPLLPLPTDMDVLSMQFGDGRNALASSLYVGTGDQAYRLKAHARQWTQIDGVGPDSAIQGISTVGGPHLAACWGVYDPVDADTVERVIHASFLLHRDEDEAGPEIRAFGIEVDPSRPSHEVVTGLTGAYASADAGKNWKRLNDLPDGEFRLAHFNSDGTVIVTGIEGSFIANPFGQGCSVRLQRRGQ